MSVRGAGLARIERLKLAASAMNNLAVAVLVSAAVVPAVGSIGGLAGAHSLAYTPLWIAAALVLHYCGDLILRGLDR